MLRVVKLLLVMSFLQRPSVPNAVEHAGEKGRVSDDLGGWLSHGRVYNERMGTDIHSWGCHDQVLNERASGRRLGGQS